MYMLYACMCACVVNVYVVCKYVHVCLYMLRKCAWTLTYMIAQAGRCWVVMCCYSVVQEETFARYWEDCVLKIRNVGVPEMRVNKQLADVQKVAFRDMISYDKGTYSLAVVYDSPSLSFVFSPSTLVPFEERQEVKI